MNIYAQMFQHINDKKKVSHPYEYDYEHLMYIYFEMLLSIFYIQNFVYPHEQVNVSLKPF